MRAKINKWNIMFMLAGNIVLGLGVAVFKLSGLGNDPYTGMVMAIADRIGMQYANFLIILNVVLFVAQIIAGRKYIGIGTFFNALLQGYVVTFFYYLVQKLGAPQQFWQQLLTVVVGLLIGGIGLAMYQNANAGTAPYDSLSLMMSDHMHRSYFGCRMFTDLVCVILCFAFGGIVHVGTVASVLLMGPVADFINRKFVSRLMAGQESLLDNKNNYCDFNA
nr:YitT family protein [uncultured Agathobacter sp.]